MKMSKAKKRTIMGFTGVILASVVFLCEAITNVTDVRATTKVFDGITTKYSPDNQVKILEITPTTETYTVTKQDSGIDQNHPLYVNKAAELGYFMPFLNAKDIAGYDSQDSYGTSPASIAMASRGGALGDPMMDGNSDAYKQMILKMREYALILPNGMDNGWFTKIGECPIYAKSSVFSASYNNSTTQEIKANFVKGVYSLTENGTGGNYRMDLDKYTLNENHEICTITKTVSVNSVTGEEEVISVSVNSAVTDINMNVLGLPTSVSGEQYIQAAEEGTGNVSFKDSEGVNTGFQEYYGYSGTSLWYCGFGQNMYRNSDWFAEYVLGSNKKYKDVDADYTVKGATEVSVQDIENADLIYISGTAQTFKSCDIKPEVMLKLYNEEINNHKAIMMDFAAYADGSTTNVAKLAMLLWQEDHSTLFSEHSDIFTTNTVNVGGQQVDVQEIASADNLTDAILKELKETMILTTGNGNFVTGNVYVYNHHMSDFTESKALVDALDNFATGDFNSTYNASVAATGFSPVINYITATNKNSLTGAMSTDVSPAVVIQYILVSDGTPLTVMKNELSVLEIEPVPAYLYNTGRGSTEYLELSDSDAAEKKVIENRKNFVDSYLSGYYGDKVQYVTFTSMTVSEFNGRNEELAEKYDIIYIGDETTRNGSNLYCTSQKVSLEWNDTKNDYVSGKVAIPDFFDDNMDGNLYYNVGDLISVERAREQWKYGSGTEVSLYGFLDGETWNVTDADKSGYANTRYAARDITKDKLKKMEEFLQNKGLMIIAENLLGSTGTTQNTVINPTAFGTDGSVSDVHGRVDSSSNLYELLKYGLGERFNESTGMYENGSESDAYEFYANMVAASDIKKGFVNKSDLNSYVSIEKLNLILTDQPTPYNYQVDGNGVITSVNYLSTKDAGGAYLNYKFTISSEMTSAEGSMTYTPHLYIDLNNDGRYSATTEDVTDIVITVDATGVEADKDTNGNYVLQKNVGYNLRRNLSSEYCGLIKWKLDIQSNLSASTHSSAEGYTLVKNETGSDKKVKILQITDNNLTSGKTGDWSGLNLEGELKKGASSRWGKYLMDVPGYDVYIKTIRISEFEDEFMAAYTNENPNHLDVAKFASQVFFPNYVIDDGTSNGASTGSSEEIVGANMLVLGFGDDIAAFEKPEAISAVKEFISQGNPVLLTHDFISFRSAALQSRILRQFVGMDVYGVTQNLTDDGQLTDRWKEDGSDNTGHNYLHDDQDYTRSADGAIVRMIEGTGKEVPYQPNSARKTVLKEKQGYTNSIIQWRRKNQGTQSKYKWINASKAMNSGDNDQRKYTVEKMNDGQITEYPYHIPESMQVAKTHSQYYTLDMSSDSDNDGESDITVWYALGSTAPGQGGANIYSDTEGASVDPANGYYIYNKGNLTYTGCGHISQPPAGTDQLAKEISQGGASEEEIKLFVNTLLAAFEVGVTEPEAGFYESTDLNAKAITSIAVPYDGNITNPRENDNTTAFDSGVTKDKNGRYKYAFVDPNTQDVDASVYGTKAYYRVADDNLARGTRDISVKYYLKVKGDPEDSFTLNDGTQKTITTLTVNGSAVTAVDITDKIKTYLAVDNAFTGEAITKNATSGRVEGIESQKAYGFYLPMDYLNNNARFTIYLEVQTKITTYSTSGAAKETITAPGYQSLTVTKADLLELD